MWNTVMWNKGSRCIAVRELMPSYSAADGGEHLDQGVAMIKDCLDIWTSVYGGIEFR